MISDQINSNLFILNPLPSWIYDYQTLEILDVNQTAIEHYGYTKEEFLSLTLKDLRPPQEVPKLNNALADIKNKEGNIYFGIFTHQKKNGNLIQMEVNGHKVDFRDRHCMLVVCQDVTKKIEQEEQILQSEQRFKALVQEGGDLIGILDAEGNYLYVSPTSISVLGITPEEFIGRSPFEFIHPQDADNVLSSLEKIATEKKVLISPFRFRNKNNEWRWIETVLTNMLDNPAVNGIVANSRDITEKIEQREKFEQSQKRFKSLVDNSLDCTIIISPEGKSSYVSGSVKNMLGYTPAEAMEFDFRDIVHPEDLAGAEKALALTLENPGVPMKGYISRVRHKNGSWRWVEPVITNLLHDPSVRGIVDNFKDITEQVNAQKQLEANELFNRTILESSPDCLKVLDSEGRLQFMNFNGLCQMEIDDFSSFKNKNWWSFWGAENEDLVKDAIDKALNGENSQFTAFCPTAKGTPKWWDVMVSPVTIADEPIQQIISVSRDVTQLKEKELEKELLGKISLNFSFENDLLSASTALCQTISDYGRFDFVELWIPSIENTHIQIFAKKSSSSNADTFYKWSKDIKSFSKKEGLPGKVWNKKTTILWEQVSKKSDYVRKEAAQKAGIKSSMGIPLIFNEKIVGVLVVGTHRELPYLEKFKGLFEQLRQFIGSEINRKKLENDLQYLYDAIPDIICITDLQGRFLKINQTGCELIGHKEEDILYQPFHKFIHPDDQEISHHFLENQRKGGKSFGFENRFVTKNGAIVWLNWTSNSNLQEGLIYATARNITEEKRLRELNRQASKLAKIGSWEVDLIKSTAFWSDMTHQIHETDPESFFPDLEESLDFYRDDFRPMINSWIAQSVTTGEPLDFEAVLVTANKNERWIRVIGNAEMVDGKCHRLFGSFQDIHDRKMSEIAMKESEVKFKTIFDIASLGIIQVDPFSGRIILANSYYENITGYTIDELLKMSFVELTHPDDREKDWEIFTKAAQGEEVYRNEKRYVKKDGTIVWVRIHLAFIRDEGGNPVKTVAICEDITDRKEAETRLQNLSDNIPGVVFQYLLYPDGTDELRYVSKGSEKIWSHSPETVNKNNDLVWDQIKAGGDFEEVKQSIKDSVENKSQWSIRYRTVSPDGEKHILHGLGTPEFLADGTVLYNTVVLDITQEARNEELLELATELSRIGSWEIDMVGNKLFWSDMVHELHETDPKTFEPDVETAINFYREDFLEIVNEEIANCLETGVGFDFEAVIITANKKERWVRAIGNAEMVNGKCQRIYGSFQDINLRKSLELQNREILESISDAFYGIDKEWNFTYFNKEAENLLKRKSEDVLGKSIWEEFSPARGTEMEEKYRNVLKTGKPATFEYWYPGDESWYEINAYPSKGGVSAFFKNIDERRKAAEELQKTYEEKNNILESIGDAFFAVDKNWIVTYWNKEAEIVLGKKRTEIVGENLWEIYADAIDTDFYRQYHKAMETGENINFEEYYATLNNWFEVTVYPSQEGLSVYFKDVTLKKEADIRLIQANERFEKVTEATSDAIWDWNIIENTLYWGDGFNKLFGYDVVKNPPKVGSWTEHIHPEDIEHAAESLDQVMQSNSDSWIAEYRFLKEDSTYANVIDRGIVIRQADGKPARMVGAMTDITEQKNQEKQLVALNESLQSYAKELERSNEELEQFAFITSHDLQEPLRMISSFMDQLKRKYEDQLDEKALQYIHYATDGAKRMKYIILDLLEYSRAGKPIDSKEQTDVNNILSEYKQLRRKIISEKSVTISTSELPTICSYKAAITQILHSLLDNSIKYSKKGIAPHIEINATETIDDWQFSIKDNGIGIDSEFYDKIFIIFQRLHNKSEYGGTGIGLSIAKKHVEFLGGKIWVDSNPGDGSTFYFTIRKTS